MTTPTIAVIGLGYVGLPLALSWVEAGCACIGIDHDPAKVATLAEGGSYLRHIPGERVAAAVAAAQLRPTSDLAQVAAADAVLICVPTPLDAHLQPDLHFVEDTCRAIAPHLRAGTLVVLESTTWPGSTREVVAPLLKAGCPHADSLAIAYSPEREDPGNAQHHTRAIPKLVGGLDAAATTAAVALYTRAFATVIPVASAEVAEAAKLFENVFRSVNIALVNELKVILDAMGIDVWAVIEAAASKPFGFMPFWPGPGLGGHCIPIDPFYLSWKAREHGVDARFIELAGEINRAMPDWVLRKIQDRLNDDGKALRGSRILILGLSYKANVDDTRESPSLALIDSCAARGAEVDYYDPLIPELLPTRRYPQLAGRRSVSPSAAYDCLVLATAHDAFVASELLALGVPIIDTRHHFPDHPLVTRA